MASAIVATVSIFFRSPESRKTNNRFRVAMLTPDGTATKSPLHPVGDQRLMYLCISSEDFALAWPEPDECLPEVGAEAPPLEGWRVDRIQDFVGDGAESLYDFPPETVRERVLVCWCIPMSAEQDNAAA